MRRAVLALPLLLAGCLGGPAGESGGRPLNDEVPAASPEWVRCWIVPDAGEDPSWKWDHLVCQLAKPADGASLPIAQVAVQALAGASVAETLELGRVPGQPVEILALSPSDYPVRVALQLLMRGDRPVGLETLGELRASTTFANAGAATATAPWHVDQPFETWDVTIDVETRILEASVLGYDLPLAPLTDATGKSVHRAAGRLPLGRQDQVLALRFAVPPGTTGIACDGRFGREVTRLPFTIDGPGAWVATATGLARAPEPELPATTEPPPADEPPPQP